MSEKLVTVFGTRPEIIRLSCLIPKLDKYFDHKIINTYQNDSENLNDLFFDQLRIRKPDYNLRINHDNYGAEVGDIINQTHEILSNESPDKMLVLGDTYSSLSVLPASKLGIKIYHMEAGMRSGDWRMPEEKNRRIVDHLSNVNLPYTETSKTNLLRENINPYNIHVIGNPIFEVLKYHSNSINMSHYPYSLLHNKNPDYVLVTIHRDENVSNYNTLENIMNALKNITKKYSVILLMHVRLKNAIRNFKITIPDGVVTSDSIGLFDFVRLEQSAKCVLTDSGTVPEECAYYKVPCVVIRDSIERPELVDLGSCVVSGTGKDQIINSMTVAMNTNKSVWDYNVKLNVSDTVLKIMVGAL